MAHPENTMRALKDLQLFVERWQCRFGWHRWTKWSDSKRDSGSLYFTQHRTCVDCGRQQIMKTLGDSRSF